MSRRLTHRDERRQAVTVDVGCKPATLCAAVGWGFVSTAPEAHRPAGSGRLPKEGPLADASLKREKPTACAVTCLPLCDRVPNSAAEPHPALGPFLPRIQSGVECPRSLGR